MVWIHQSPRRGEVLGRLAPEADSIFEQTFERSKLDHYAPPTTPSPSVSCQKPSFTIFPSRNTTKKHSNKYTIKLRPNKKDYNILRPATSPLSPALVGRARRPPCARPPAAAAQRATSSQPPPQWDDQLLRNEGHKTLTY